MITEDNLKIAESLFNDYKEKFEEIGISSQEDFIEQLKGEEIVSLYDNVLKLKGEENSDFRKGDKEIKRIFTQSSKSKVICIIEDIFVANLIHDHNSLKEVVGSNRANVDALKKSFLFKDNLCKLEEDVRKKIDDIEKRKRTRSNTTCYEIGKKLFGFINKKLEYFEKNPQSEIDKQNSKGGLNHFSEKPKIPTKPRPWGNDQRVNSSSDNKPEKKRRRLNSVESPKPLKPLVKDLNFITTTPSELCISVENADSSSVVKRKGDVKSASCPPTPIREAISRSNTMSSFSDVNKPVPKPRMSLSNLSKTNRESPDLSVVSTPVDDAGGKVKIPSSGSTNSLLYLSRDEKNFSPNLKSQLEKIQSKGVSADSVNSADDSSIKNTNEMTSKPVRVDSIIPGSSSTFERNSSANQNNNQVALKGAVSGAINPNAPVSQTSTTTDAALPRCERSDKDKGFTSRDEDYANSLSIHDNEFEDNASELSNNEVMDMDREGKNKKKSQESLSLEDENSFSVQEIYNKKVLKRKICKKTAGIIVMSVCALSVVGFTIAAYFVPINIMNQKLEFKFKENLIYDSVATGLLIISAAIIVSSIALLCSRHKDVKEYEKLEQEQELSDNEEPSSESTNPSVDSLQSDGKKVSGCCIS